MLAASTAHDFFDGLVVAHVICAVIGFGSLMLSGVYGFSNRDPAGPETLEEARRYFRSPGHLELLVVAVPFLGVAALLVQPHGRGAAQAWDLAAAGIWLVAVGVLFGVTRPAERQIRAALFAGRDAGGEGAEGEGADRNGADGEQGAVDVAVLSESARRLGWAGVGTDLAFLAALILMIFQPH